MAKRANGEGNVRQRVDGRWEASLSYVDPTTETRRRTYVYGKTAAEARRELKKIQQRIDEGQPAKDAPDTVGSWLKRWRESSLAASDRKPTTKSLYGSLSRTHLEDAEIGGKRLDRLRPSDVEALIVELRDALLASNPAAKVKRPAVARQEARYLPAADVARLLDAAKELRYYVAVVLMAATGLRRGEVCGLLWSDVDLDKGELRVRHTLSRVDRELVLTEPKTDRSRRRVPLHTGVVTALKGWRKQQVAERLAAGDQWSDTGVVFATELGTMVDPRNLLRTVELAAAKAGIENVGAHTMRHSAAVAWLESGVHIKAAADLLGHSSISITGDLYGHTSDDTARAAVDGLGAALGL